MNEKVFPKVIISIISLIIYCIIFHEFYYIFPDIIGLLVVIPVVIFTYFFGSRLGIIAAFLALPFNLFLYQFKGLINEFSIDFVLKNNIWLPWSILIFIVGVLGKISDLRRKLEKELNKRKDIGKELKKSEEKFRSLVNSMEDIVLTLDEELNYTAVFGLGIERKGINKEDFVGKNMFEVFENTKVLKHQRMARKALNGEQAFYEWKFEPDTAPPIYFHTSMSPLKDSDGDIIGVVAVLRDITELKKLQKKLKEYATTDQMTGVLNRRTGIEFLENKINENKQVTISFIDINNLKVINDSYGHNEGDETIKLVSDTLKSNIRDSDVVCRLGGDEFILIFPRVTQQKAETICKRIEEELWSIDKENKKPYSIRISYGFAEYTPDSGLDAEELINIADKEMYKDKQEKKKQEK